jgi:hypothetical protein
MRTVQRCCFIEMAGCLAAKNSGCRSGSGLAEAAAQSPAAARKACMRDGNAIRSSTHIHKDGVHMTSQSAKENSSSSL